LVHLYYQHFFVLTPRPPTSPLFPYTTLFRSRRCPCGRVASGGLVPPLLRRPGTGRAASAGRDPVPERKRPALRLLRARHRGQPRDRKSTRLNSSHGSISYAVFCLKKKNMIIY